jgi:CheY-like chemotaxis protein
MSALPVTLGNRRPARALLVDDDPMMLAVLGDMLKSLGVGAVTTADSGQRGIEALDRCNPPPELIVCDLNMPGTDGFQFMEQLAARGFSGGVILVSGMDARTLKSASLMARFHRLQMLGSLDKPVDEIALAQALEKLA